MHIVYIGQHGILDLHYFSTSASVAILLGSGYGFVRALIDGTRTMRELFRGR